MNPITGFSNLCCNLRKKCLCYNYYKNQQNIISNSNISNDYCFGINKKGIHGIVDMISNSELISDINSSVFNNKDLDIRSGSVVLYDNERFIVRGIDNNEAILFSIADNTNVR
jgi:uncharacterized protein YkvS